MMKILITEEQLRLLTEQKSIFIPRRMEDRKERHKDVIYKQIQDYIKNGSKGDLHLTYSPIESLPNNLTEVNGYLNLYKCTSLTSLPDNLSVSDTLNLQKCSSLTSLPDNLTVGWNLILTECTSLDSLPKNLKVSRNIYLENTPLDEKLDRYEIKRIIESKGGSVGGYIHTTMKWST